MTEWKLPKDALSPITNGAMAGILSTMLLHGVDKEMAQNLVAAVATAAFEDGVRTASQTLPDLMTKKLKEMVCPACAKILKLNE
jgi:hypothetical protein